METKWLLGLVLVAAAIGLAVWGFGVVGTIDNLLRPILRLAAPVLAEESLTMLVGYTDWWLVGHYLLEPTS